MLAAAASVAREPSSGSGVAADCSAAGRSAGTTAEVPFFALSRCSMISRQTFLPALLMTFLVTIGV